MENITKETAFNLLNEDNNYKVLKRLTNVQRYSEDDQSEKRTGIYLDCETTGLDVNTCKIIELGMVVFEYSANGRIFNILQRIDVYEDPNESITEEITALTGITDDMVKDQQFNTADIEQIASTASIIIAHNATFDRPFMEKRFPIFIDKAWGCSMRDINWTEEGISSQKLDYLAFNFNFFFEGHRADIDAAAGLHLLSQTSKVHATTLLDKLLKTARLPSYRIWAMNAPFDKKDLLKSRGYRWSSGDDGKKKAWYFDAIGDEAFNTEQEYLNSDIYKGRSLAVIDNVTAFNRYSDRY